MAGPITQTRFSLASVFRLVFVAACFLAVLQQYPVLVEGFRLNQAPPVANTVVLLACWTVLAVILLVEEKRFVALLHVLGLCSGVIAAVALSDSLSQMTDSPRSLGFLLMGCWFGTVCSFVFWLLSLPQRYCESDDRWLLVWSMGRFVIVGMALFSVLPAAAWRHNMSVALVGGLLGVFFGGCDAIMRSPQLGRRAVFGLPWAFVACGLLLGWVLGLGVCWWSTQAPLESWIILWMHGKPISQWYRGGVIRIWGPFAVAIFSGLVVGLFGRLWITAWERRGRSATRPTAG